MISPVIVDGFVLLVVVFLMVIAFTIGYAKGYKVAKKKSEDIWNFLSRTIR